MLHHHYHQLNQPLLPTLTFLHGDTLDSRQWQPQVEYFQAKFNLLTYDLRGYGQNPYPTDPYFHPNDLFHLLTDLNIVKTHLIGSSFGGEQAINFALTYPEAVSSLTLIDTSLSGFPCKVNWDVGAKTDGLDLAKTRWLNHLVFAQTQNYPSAYQQISDMVNTYNGHYWLNPQLCQKLNPPGANRLEDLSCPINLIVGEHDLTYFHNISLHIYQQIRISATSPLCNLNIIPSSGHLPALEQPIVVNDLISKFIQQVSASIYK